MKRENKKLVLGLVLGLVIAGSISLASTLVTGNVYFNPYKILLNGKEHITNLPILNYNDSTYVPLRELATLTGSKVDFKDSKIIINNTSNNGDNEIKTEDILGEWIPQYAEDENGNETGLNLIYGSGIKYGASLDLYENGKYTNYIGVLPDNAEELFSGNFIIKGNEIQLTAKNGSVHFANVKYDNDGKMCLKINDRGYDVYYYKVIKKYVDILKVEKKNDYCYLVTVQEYEQYRLNDNQMSNVINGKEIYLPNEEGKIIKLKFTYNSMSDAYFAEIYNEKLGFNLEYMVDREGYYELASIQNGQIYRKKGNEKQYEYYDGKVYFYDEAISIEEYMGEKHEAKEIMRIGELHYIDEINGHCLKIVTLY